MCRLQLQRRLLLLTQGPAQMLAQSVNAVALTDTTADG